MAIIGFRTITDFQDFCTLEAEWDELLDQHPAPNVFLTHAWMKCWWEVFGDQGEMLVFTHHENEKLDFIAPLMRSTRKYLRYIPKKTIHFIGIDRSDYQDFIYSKANERLIMPLLDELANRYPKDLISFDNIVEHSPSRKILDKYLEAGNNGRKAQTTTAPYINLPDVTKKDFRKKTYMNLKRQLNRDGELILRQVERNEIDKYLSVLFELHQEKWEDQGLFKEDKNKTFYHKLARGLFEKGLLDLSILSHDGEVVAIHFGFLYNNTFYYYKPTYNEEFAKYSPGNILLMELIDVAKKKELEIFDFLKGEETYKFRYTNRSISLYQYLLSNGEILNRSLLQVMNGRKKLASKGS